MPPQHRRTRRARAGLPCEAQRPARPAPGRDPRRAGGRQYTGGGGRARRRPGGGRVRAPAPGASWLGGSPCVFRRPGCILNPYARTAMQASSNIPQPTGTPGVSWPTPAGGALVHIHTPPRPCGAPPQRGACSQGLPSRMCTSCPAFFPQMRRTQGCAFAISVSNCADGGRVLRNRSRALLEWGSGRRRRCWDQVHRRTHQPCCEHTHGSKSLLRPRPPARTHAHLCRCVH